MGFLILIVIFLWDVIKAIYVAVYNWKACFDADPNALTYTDYHGRLRRIIDNRVVISEPGICGGERIYDASTLKMICDTSPLKIAIYEDKKMQEAKQKGETVILLDYDGVDQEYGRIFRSFHLYRDVNTQKVYVKAKITSHFGKYYFVDIDSGQVVRLAGLTNIACEITDKDKEDIKAYSERIAGISGYSKEERRKIIARNLYSY